MCRFCARGANVTTRRARARARGGGDMFLRMVSSCVVNLGCQTFEIPNFVSWVSQRFASREHRTRDILPKRSATGH